jgi:transposase InsO family protein
MKANQATHSVATMCRVLGVSASGYYAWQGRRVSPRRRQDDALLRQVQAFHQQSRGTYGAPRIHRDLREAGVRVGRKRVARLLTRAGLRGVSRRKWPVTTVRAAQAGPAPDLVQRVFTATGPNQLWVADITYIPTATGFLYLAVVLDVWSRRIVGWAMATHLRTELVMGALDMAIAQRRPVAVIHHSDHGCQYTALEFGRRCREAGVRPSMGSVGDCYDNALCESFFATLECELLERVTVRTPAEARTAVFDFIEGWYNPTRRHSALDYRSPIDFEQLAPHAFASPPSGTDVPREGPARGSCRPCGPRTERGAPRALENAARFPQLPQASLSSHA